MDKQEKVWTLKDFNENKPKAFDPDEISMFLNFLDRQRDLSEVDFVALEKMNNNKVSMAQAKAQATIDDRYIKVKKELRNKKLLHLFWKSLAKNGWSHCENLKQSTINDLAIQKLSK